MSPALATATVPASPVATLLRPMYRPEAALGMMSVMSAQSTARKVPAARPMRTAPTSATGTMGATTMIAEPRPPTAHAR